MSDSARRSGEAPRVDGGSFAGNTSIYFELYGTPAPPEMRDVHLPDEVYYPALGEAAKLKAMAGGVPPTHTPAVADDPRAALKGEELALAMLVAHPDWNDTRIANEIGCSRTSLIARWKKFRAARKAMGATLPTGSKSKDGDMEAWEE